MLMITNQQISHARVCGRLRGLEGRVKFGFGRAEVGSLHQTPMFRQAEGGTLHATPEATLIHDHNDDDDDDDDG